MDLVIVVKLSTTLLKMLDLVETCILYLRRKALLYTTTLYISNQHSGSIYVIYVLLKSGGHELYTATG
jgi:hypothetical protein